MSRAQPGPLWVQFTRGGACAVFGDNERERAESTLRPGMTLLRYVLARDHVPVDHAVTGAIAFLRENFRCDGAEGESVHLVCDELERWRETLLGDWIYPSAGGGLPDPFQVVQFVTHKGVCVGSRDESLQWTDLRDTDASCDCEKYTHEQVICWAPLLSEPPTKEAAP